MGFYHSTFILLNLNLAISMKSTDQKGNSGDHEVNPQTYQD